MSEQRTALREFLTLGEAAEILRLSRATIWRRIRDGDLEACYFGQRSCRIPKAALDDYIAGSMRASRPGGGNGD